MPAVSRLVQLRHGAERRVAVVDEPYLCLLGGELVADEKKIEQVLSRLSVDRVDVAYGDTILDVPLLEHADHPVAVYPDAKLKAVAVERGWEIMGDTPGYP